MKSAIMEDVPSARIFWRRHAISHLLEETYLASCGDLHRDWVVEAVRNFGAVESVLEVGCHCGPLLRRLEQLPGVIALGIDINTQAVQMAHAAGLAAVDGALPEVLGGFEDRSVDVAVSSYCLAYLSPKDLVIALCHLLRIVRRGLVIAEPMAGAGIGPGMWQRTDNGGGPTEWRHDYFVALDSAVLNMSAPPTVTMTRLARGPHAGINALVVASLKQE